MNQFFESLARFPHAGEILSVVAAIAWAIAVILFQVSGRKVHPLALNLYKSMAASLFFLITLTAAGKLSLPAAPLETWIWLAASGIIGIAVSDTYFFKCLNLIGAGRTAVMECLYSPFVIILSLAFLQEHVGGWRILGVILILSAIVIISIKKNEAPLSKKNLMLGIYYGTVSMLLQSSGIIMFKPQLGRIPLLWAMIIRTAAGTAALGMTLALRSDRREIAKPLLVLGNWKTMIAAAFFGTYFGLFAWMAGIKMTQATIAAPLNQLTTIFIFILAVVFLKEKVTWAKVAAVVVAFAGAFLSSL